MRIARTTALTALLVGLLVVAISHGCDGTMGGVWDGGAGDGARDGTAVKCPGGIDADGDGYGKGCPAGEDCDDDNPHIHPGAEEVCNGKDDNCNQQTDEGVLNACGTCGKGCTKVGGKPFPVDKSVDPGVKDANGVGLDKNGDLVLDTTKKNFNYMWIANSRGTGGAKGGCTWATDSSYKPALDPYCRGTVSKIDTVNMKEVARYFTLTCRSTSAGSTANCVDLHGKAIDREFPHAPSRTAVDYNFDVWVANRAFGGQPSATKIVNDVSDCIDRNGNKTIETSRDLDGDGKIEVDCDGDGKPDSGATVCTGAHAGKNPEFYGDDDECVLFTVNYGDVNDYGRSVCLDGGIDVGASNAWVGTFNHKLSTGTAANRFYKIDGKSGKLSGPFPVAQDHHTYGCVVDSKRVLWSVDYTGSLTYLNTVTPSKVGPLLKPPTSAPFPAKFGFYGITTDGKGDIWLGGWSSGYTWRYQPNRTSWAKLAQGKWTAFKQPGLFDYSRGIAADDRGKIWVAINKGYIFRIDASKAHGTVHDESNSKDYWQTKGAGVIGVGVDFAGHVWGISYNDNVASRLDVDSKGDPIAPVTSMTKNVPVGKNPYTYSDFTGYGLQNFTRPQGRYVYQMRPCKAGIKAKWLKLIWSSTEPSGTSVTARVRSGDSESALGAWTSPYKTSPVSLVGPSSGPSPNPSYLIQVEFTLKTSSKNISPVLHEFDIAYTCEESPN